MSEFGLLSNFSDTRATSHLLVLPASTSGHIYDVIGTPPERKGGVNQPFEAIAYQGSAIMLAAFLEKRGVSTENAEALLAVEQAIAQNKLPSSENIISYNAYEAVSEFHDRFWIVNRTIEDYDNVVSQAFRIGAGILALSRVARRFTDHTGVGLLKDYAISVENGEHVDYDYTLQIAVSRQQTSRDIGRILNTRPVRAVGISIHSYKERFDGRLRFSAPTGKSGHTVVSNLDYSAYESVNGELRVNIDSSSYHVQTRETAVAVDKRGIPIDITVGEITDSIASAMDN